MPADVFYLMPEFGNGTVYFRGQPPAQGKLNICAVDNTLRFIDNKGTELSASNPENIFKVQIDTALFLRHNDVFYRMIPYSSDMGVAVRRSVHIIRDAKQGAYGTVSQTNAIKEYSTIYADGVAYNLNTAKQYPYRVYEEFFIYKGDAVFPINKKGLRKVFPDKKAKIDEWYSNGGIVPETVEGLMEMLYQLSD